MPANPYRNIPEAPRQPAAPQPVGTNRLLEMALAYGERGMAVIPLNDVVKGFCSCREGKDCPNPAKHPRIMEWTTRSTADPDEIRRFWGMFPSANIGLDCGKAGVLVIDIDPRHGGDETWAALVAKYNIPTETRQTITGGGGRQLHYLAPEGVKIKNQAGVLGPGVDNRAAGGQVVLPPSLHASGKRYAWDTRYSDMLPAPRALVDLLAGAGSRPQFNGTAARAHNGSTPIEAAIEAIRNAPEGARNDTLNREAFVLGQFVGAGAVDRAEVEEQLHAAAQDSGLPDSEIAATVKHALDDGEKEPREPAADSGTPTDDELRDRVRDTYPEIVYGLGEFQAFNGAVYRPLEREIVRQRITTVLEAAKAEGVRPSTNKVSSVADMLRDKLFIPSSVWNADTDLLPCQNGVLHIPTRELRPHSRENYFTSALPYAYDPSAVANTWLWFVGDVLTEAAEFVQEFAGYALTGDTALEIALWLHGTAGCGKSTFLLGLQRMLGDRVGLLSLADVERSRFALADVPGKTLLVSTEQPSDYIASGAKLNALISGEPLTVERKFRDAVVIVSRAKLAWAMNSLPRVGDSNSGLFRRVKVIKFPPLAEDKRDPGLKSAIAAEGAGILNWALDGLDRLNERKRFDVPAGVLDATEEFRSTNDIPAQFVAERCVTRPDIKAQAGQLYKAYKEWCFETGHKAQSSTSLAADWQRLGFDRHRAQGRAYWHGVGLAEDA